MMFWNRCSATSTAFHRIRRCDLYKDHNNEHLSNQALDQFLWIECREWADSKLPAFPIEKKE